MSSKQQKNTSAKQTFAPKPVTLPATEESGKPSFASIAAASKAGAAATAKPTTPAQKTTPVAPKPTQAQPQKPAQQQTQQPKQQTTPVKKSVPAAAEKVEEESSSSSFLAMAAKGKSAPAAQAKPSPVATVKKTPVAPAVEEKKIISPETPKQTLKVETPKVTESPSTPKSPAAEGETSPSSPGEKFEVMKKKKAYTGVSSKSLTEKVRIPEGSAAYIIGRQGTNVKRINEQSGAKCMVKDTSVTITGNNKQQIEKAKKQVMDLLRAYLTRTQSQSNEYHLLMLESEVEVEKTLCNFNQYSGPVSEWLVREQMAPKKEGEEKKEETTEAPVKRNYYTASLEAIKQNDEPEDEEDELISRFVQMKSSKESSKESKEKMSTQDDSGAQVLLVDEEVMKSTLSSLAEKLAEEKKWLEENNMEESKNSFNIEIILGKKLFLTNPTNKKVKKSQQKFEETIEPIGMKKLLESKFGYNQKLNFHFNYAVPENCANTLESAIKEKGFKLVDQREVVSAHIRLNNKRAGVLLLIERDAEEKSEEGTTLKHLKVLDYFERSTKLIVIDFIRPEEEKLDYRFYSKHYANVGPSEQFQQICTARIRFDPVKGELVVLPKPEKKAEEGAEAKEEEELPKFSIAIDRVKNEKIYSDDVRTIVISKVKDTLKEPTAKKDKKKKKEEEKKAGEGGEASTTTETAQEEEKEEVSEVPAAAKVVIETTEISITTSKLTFETIKEKELVLKQVKGFLGWVSGLLDEQKL